MTRRSGISNRKTTWAHRFYWIGIVLKGLDGAIEATGGLLFLCIRQPALTHWVDRFTSPLIDGDADDWVAHSIQNAFAHMPGATRILAGIYLLAHGLVKAALVVMLLRGNRYAFPIAITALTVLVSVQIVRLVFTHSVMLEVVTAMDIGIGLLIWNEFRHRKSSSLR